MSSAIELTYQDVAEHNTKKDLYVVIHEKIYDCSQFIDEHPGGEEVLLDCAGQDATAAFQDVGHSDAAGKTLDKIQIGSLKRQPGDNAPKTTPPTATNSNPGSSYGSNVGVYFIFLIGGVLSYFALQYMAKQQEAQQAGAA